MENKTNPYSNLNRLIIIAQYDNRWPSMFMHEKNRLMSALHGCIVIEHVGSTSIQGMSAKPTVDLALGIPSFREAPEYIQGLQVLGYQYHSALEDVMPNRRFLWAGTPQDHLFHIHLVEHMRVDWLDLIYFRDYLRINQTQAAAYEAVKRKLAASCGSDIGAYAHEKTAIYQTILAEARRDIA